MNEEIPDLGEIAYAAYVRDSEGKSLVTGTPLPTWEEQAPRIKQAWRAAAMAVVDTWQAAGR